MVYIKTYIFNHFHQQYLVLLTMVPRNRIHVPPVFSPCDPFTRRVTSHKKQSNHAINRFQAGCPLLYSIPGCCSSEGIRGRSSASWKFPRIFSCDVKESQPRFSPILARLGGGPRLYPHATWKLFLARYSGKVGPGEIYPQPVRARTCLVVWAFFCIACLSCFIPSSSDMLHA